MEKIKPLTPFQKRFLEAKAAAKERQIIKDELGKEFCDSMYDNISKQELDSAVLNAKWLTVKDFAEKNENSDIYEMYGLRGSSLAGYTDYTNHTNDTLEQLKELTLKELETRLMQKLNYWSTCGKLFDTIILRGSYGGWDAKCAWSDGSQSFSTIS